VQLRLVLFATLLALGCDRNPSNVSSPSSTGASNSPTGYGGSPAAAALLQPFQGNWKFNLEKTLALWKSKGASQKEIDEARAMTAIMPLHPDMALQGDVAVLKGTPGEGEYAFFALHAHPQFICGKAWHHEDRHDPGDMDKYVVRLQLHDAELWLSTRVPEDAADPADPEVTNPIPLAGSAATCIADSLKDPPWSPWQIYIFEPAK
jgi:hypothetical protein